MSEKEDACKKYTFKLLMIGDSGVGKSCILLRFVEDNFNEKFVPTIGVDLIYKDITMDNKLITLQLVRKNDNLI